MNAYTIKSIPTMYAGVQFRSRLEAKWAAFFDLGKLRWEYEPFDCNGYVPDFVVFGKNRSALVEVKPEAVFDEGCQQTLNGIAAAKSMGYHFLVLTERWHDHETISCWKMTGFIYQYLPAAPEYDDRMPATLWRTDDGRLDFGAEDLCSLSLHGDGCSPFEGDELQELWREAGNIVQWKSPRASYQRNAA